MSLNYNIYKVFLFLRINLLPSVLIYTIFFGVNIKNIKKICLKKEIIKYITILYILMLFKITGITEMVYQLHNLLRVKDMEIICPFVGNSFSMISFNFLLFVPMGLLIPLVISIEWNRKRILVLGLVISGFIEGLQLLGGRLPEMDDILANAMGCYGGFLVLRLFNACKEQEKNKMWKYIIELIILLVLFFVPIGLVADEDRMEYVDKLENEVIFWG